MSIEDRAQDHEILEWTRNNSLRATQKNFAPGEPGYGPAECDFCEANMPVVRRAYGYRLCVECKSAQERSTGR